VMLNFDTASTTDFWEDARRYGQGQIKMDEFLREMEKKARMIFLEGQ